MSILNNYPLLSQGAISEESSSIINGICGDSSLKIGDTVRLLPVGTGEGFTQSDDLLPRVGIVDSDGVSSYGIVVGGDFEGAYGIDPSADILSLGLIAAFFGDGVRICTQGKCLAFADGSQNSPINIGDELTATDGSATFSRTTLEILPFYQITETARVGLGLIHVMSPSYSDPYDSMTFDDTTGFLVEVDWRTQGSSWWGIRFANIDYTVATFNGIDVSSSAVPLDGNYFGVIFHAGF